MNCEANLPFRTSNGSLSPFALIRRRTKLGMRTSFLRSENTWLSMVLIATCGLVPAAWAQGSAEDVHITPRVERPRPQSDRPVDDPALTTHTKPIKVDVNLVLVSVSILDPLNRQVIGLDKENSQVFEGKEREE